MTEPILASEILDYYTNWRDEARRLVDSADGRLELLRTQELLRRHLPAAPADVLDIGGGTGAHSTWLAADGHRVQLIDPVPHHVQAAQDAGLLAAVGDARALDFPDASFDVAFVAGPMYHLPDPADRAQVLAEARRVLRPGGLVAVAAIGRYASVFENAGLRILNRPRLYESVAGILTSGQLIEPPAGRFTTAQFHSADGLAEEIASAGFGDVSVFSVEGPAWGMLKAVEARGERIGDEDPLFLSVLAAARLADDYPELMSAASHLLAVGRSG